MKKSWLEIYALAVCFFTVACFVVFLGFAAWDLVKVMTPDFTMYSADWEKHQSDEAFKASLIREHRCSEDKSTYMPPEGAALTKAREESYAQELRSESRNGFQDLMRNFIILLIDMFMFMVHWKIAAGARQNVS